MFKRVKPSFISSAWTNFTDGRPTSARFMSPVFDLIVIIGFLISSLLLKMGATKAAHEIYDRLVDWLYTT